MNAMNTTPETTGTPGTTVMPAAGATPEQIAHAYRAVADATKAASSNFYYAFVTLPPAKRNSVYAGYAFCRLADDIVVNCVYVHAAG